MTDAMTPTETQPIIAFTEGRNAEYAVIPSLRIHSVALLDHDPARRQVEIFYDAEGVKRGLQHHRLLANTLDDAIAVLGVARECLPCPTN